jgi:polysaccharide export outer membrane protein
MKRVRVGRGRTERSGLKVAVAVLVVAGAMVAGAAEVGAQGPAQQAGAQPGPETTRPFGSTPVATAGVGVSTPAAPAVPVDYKVGVEDIFSVKVWEDDRIKGDVIVGPDGTISLPLINSVRAAGLTFEQFRETIADAAKKYVLGTVTVELLLKQINSRFVCVGGEVKKPGKYPLIAPTNVYQLIVAAGGLTEYANKKHLNLIRTENSKQRSIAINFDDIQNGKNLDKFNIDLKPGDCLSVPD